MDLGVYLAYAPWIALDEQLQVARETDELGFHSAWVAETWGQDATAVLSALAVTTQNIRLGAAIMQIPARQPTTAASAISTIDQLSNGRAMLGLGLSGPQVSEGWYGCRSSHRWAGPGVHRYRPHGTRTGEGRVSRQALPPAG